MRSPDDDDEVHNSISKLLWLRQPLSAHLSSLFVRSAFWWELIWNSNVVGVTKIIFNVVPIPRISLDHNKTQNSAPKIQKTWNFEDAFIFVLLREKIKWQKKKKNWKYLKGIFLFQKIWQNLQRFFFLKISFELDLN